MTIEKNKRSSVLTFRQLGIFLFCIYIFLTYVAHNVMLPSQLSAIALYIFLGVSFLRMFVIRNMRINKMTVWQLVFMGVSLLSMVYSPHKSILSGAFYRLIVNLVLVLCLSQYELNKRDVERIARVFSVSSVFVMLLLSMTGNLSDSTGRLGADFIGSSIVFAQMIMISCLFSMWLFVYADKKWYQKCASAIAILAAYIAIFLSGGRKYIVVPLIFLYVLLLFKQDRKGQKHIIKYTIIIAIVTVLIYNLIMNIPDLYSIIGRRVEMLLRLIFEGEVNVLDGSANFRGQMIQMGLEKWIESPIWGYGLESFKYYNQSVTGEYLYAHNNYVELLYNLGLIGFFAYYSFYIRMLMAAIKNRVPLIVENRAFVIAMIVSLFVFEYGQVDYSDNNIAIVLFVVFTMLNQREGKMEQYEK